MRKEIVLLLLLAALITSCSHNGMFIAKGKVWSLSEKGFVYVNGIGLWDFSRENTKMTVKAEDADGLGEDKSVSSKLEASREIGKQVTGYAVDLSKECPEAVVEYFKTGEQPTE